MHTRMCVYMGEGGGRERGEREFFFYIYNELAHMIYGG